jgi:hypothetical protein
MPHVILGINQREIRNLEANTPEILDTMADDLIPNVTLPPQM